MDYFAEAQKQYSTTLKEIHTKTYNILHKLTNKEAIQNDLIKLLEYEFGEMANIEKDIKISESDTCNNNSLL